MGISPADFMAKALVAPPNEIGQPTFIEVMIVDQVIGTTYINVDFPFPCAQLCNEVSGCKVFKDLIDPSTITVVKQAGLIKGINDLSNYTAFFRNFKTKVLSQTTMDALITTKDSIVFIENILLESQNPLVSSCSQDTNPIARAQIKVSKNEILPSRFTWL